jgi:hypothetical protein
MMHWIELAAASAVGFCLGVVFMGALMKGARRIAVEDAIIKALRELLPNTPPPKE